jgi:L-ascorbate metabolism protein UlaG (beta-lactamase superfamily)
VVITFEKKYHQLNFSMNSFISDQQKLAVKTGAVGISWTGQAGFAFKDSEGLVYHIDPYFSDVCSKTIGYHRIVPPPVEAQNVTADFILITHKHHDHLDDGSIPTIAEANPDLTFAAPPASIHCLKELGISPNRLMKIQKGECKQIGNVNVKAVLSHHTKDSVGYILQFDDLTFYHTGDTTYSDDLISVRKDHPDVMMTCINGRLGCMNIPDAARLTAHIQPQFAVPMHYGMFRENTADPEEFIRQVEAYSGITNGFIMKQGEWYVFSEEEGFTSEYKDEK